MKKSLLVIVLLTAMFSSSLRAQFVLNGSASVTTSACSSTTYQLTPDSSNKGGSIWYTNLINLNNPLDVQYQIFLGNKGYSIGADGIVFVLQPVSTVVGGSGGGMGFSGITPSLGVEFDTYQNGWDPAYCHVAIEKNGDVNHTDLSGNNLAGPVQLSPTNPLLPDGAWHSMRIMWNPVSTTISVYFDCSLRLTYTGNIIANVFGGNPNVYWGFTGGTGGDSNTQQVCITHSFLQNLSDTTICYGASVSLTASGGVTYTWTPATGLSTTSGPTVIATPSVTTKYYVTITDACGITTLDSSTITVSHTILTPSFTPASCGNNNGTASVVAAGGLGAYTYSWNNGQTTTTATGLLAGPYTVTVTDSLGCNATASVTVTQPSALTVTTAAPVNVLCNGGNNGSDLATAAGGTPAYTYSWNTIPVQTNATVTGLTAGTYTVTATDANGCTATTSVIITQPTSLSATTTTVSSTCGNPNGSATAIPAGGTATYTYAWNTVPIQTTVTATGLSAGTYIVNVTDANGCTFTATAVVSNITAETVSINPPTNVLCNGGNNGSATPAVVGGVTPYTYSWSTLPVQTNATATGLTAGTYTLTVTDANGCIATAITTITQPPLLTVTSNVLTNVPCNGGNNGSVTASGAGGTGAYTYSWATVPVQTNANATGLTAGIYTINITDANGCTASATAIITQPAVLSLTAAGFPVTCNGGSDGQATVIPAGGTAPYTYLWSNLSTQANANNLVAGNYTITITDANGCTHDTTVAVTQPLPIVVAFAADTVNSCSPLCTGFTDASTDPGGTIIKWNWSYSDGGTDTVQNPRHCFKAPGAYSVTLTVTDNHGCTSTLTIPNMTTVYSFPVAAFTMGPQPATIVNPVISFTDKSTDAYGIAGWLWNFNDPQNEVGSNLQNPTHAYNDTGTYCAALTVTNIHGCIDSITECLIISPQFTLYIPDAFSPNGDGLNDIFLPKGEFMKSFDMSVFDRWGLLLFHSNDINKGWNGAYGGTVCQVDTYVYIITVVDNQEAKHTYIGKVTLVK